MHATVTIYETPNLNGHFAHYFVKKKVANCIKISLHGILNTSILKIFLLSTHTSRANSMFILEMNTEYKTLTLEDDIRHISIVVLENCCILSEAARH